MYVKISRRRLVSGRRGLGLLVDAGVVLWLWAEKRR